jgi:competence protein ComEA
MREEIENLQSNLSLYKTPLILGGIGAALLILAVGLLLKSQITASDVVFTTNASSSAAVKIRIDVAGAVISPGVYEFFEGDRVSDALTSAGGLSVAADRNWVAKNLNRAAKLVDGGKIYIPSQIEEKVPAPLSGTSTGEQNLINLGNIGVSEGKVNLNAASQTELEALPGIGPVYAGKIISGRPYQSVEELKTRKILGQSLYNKLKDLLTVY